MGSFTLNTSKNRQASIIIFVSVVQNRRKYVINSTLTQRKTFTLRVPPGIGTLHPHQFLELIIVLGSDFSSGLPLQDALNHFFCI